MLITQLYSMRFHVIENFLDYSVFVQTFQAIFQVNLVQIWGTIRVLSPAGARESPAQLFSQFERKLKNRRAITDTMASMRVRPADLPICIVDSGASPRILLHCERERDL